VPELSRFLGIVITMFYRDHAPPHFHASYGEFDIEDELRENWNLAAARKPLKKIAPLE